jgi:hypothetical protein
MERRLFGDIWFERFWSAGEDLSLVGTRVESVLPQLGMDASKEIDGG